jgi:DNA-binding Lrp family transcriptional regulator
MNDLPKRPLDSFDQAILRMLQQDNKTSQRVIAEAIGLSTPRAAASPSSKPAG